MGIDTIMLMAICLGPMFLETIVLGFMLKHDIRMDKE